MHGDSTPNKNNVAKSNIRSVHSAKSIEQGIPMHALRHINAFTSIGLSISI